MLADILLVALAFILGGEVALWLKHKKRKPQRKRYTPRNLKHLRADEARLKQLIAKASTSKELKALAEPIYNFSETYRGFNQYSVDVDKATDELVAFFDAKLYELNGRRPKNKLVIFFLN